MIYTNMRAVEEPKEDKWRNLSLICIYYKNMQILGNEMDNYREKWISIAKKMVEKTLNILTNIIMT